MNYGTTPVVPAWRRAGTPPMKEAQMKKLVLKSESIIDLSDAEMAVVAGADASQSCVLTWVCISVNNCVTTNCTWTAVC